MMWYRREKAKEDYKANNPNAATEALVAKYKGPLTGLAFLGGGFYLLPLVKGVIDGVSKGGSAVDVLSSVAGSLADPSAAVR